MHEEKATSYIRTIVSFPVCIFIHKFRQSLCADSTQTVTKVFPPWNSSWCKPKFVFTCSVDIKSVRSISFQSKRTKVQMYWERFLSERSEIRLSDLIHVVFVTEIASEISFCKPNESFVAFTGTRSSWTRLTGWLWISKHCSK